MLAGLGKQGTRKVVVEPCPHRRDQFRWAMLSGTGELEERSAYAYATAIGARLAGEIRLVETRKGR